VAPLRPQIVRSTACGCSWVPTEPTLWRALSSRHQHSNSARNCLQRVRAVLRRV